MALREEGNSASQRFPEKKYVDEMALKDPNRTAKKIAAVTVFGLIIAGGCYCSNKSPKCFLTMLDSFKDNDDHFSGNPDASVTLLIYEDFECEYCKKAYHEIKKLKEYFNDQLCIIYRNFPFIAMHPSSLLAASVIEACALQNNFIQARDMVFDCQDFLEYGLGGILHLLEKNYSISLEKLRIDLKRDIIKNKIDKDIKSGAIKHITNTPAFFINGHRYIGAVKFEQFLIVIEAAVLQVTV